MSGARNPARGAIYALYTHPRPPVPLSLNLLSFLLLPPLFRLVHLFQSLICDSAHLSVISSSALVFRPATGVHDEFRTNEKKTIDVHPVKTHPNSCLFTMFHQSSAESTHCVCVCVCVSPCFERANFLSGSSLHNRVLRERSTREERSPLAHRLLLFLFL